MALASVPIDMSGFVVQGLDRHPMQDYARRG